MVLLSIRDMRVVRKTHTQAAEWLADAVSTYTVPPEKRKLMPTRPSKDTAGSSIRAVIASSVFIILLAAALLAGGHAAIDPFLHPSLDMADARGSSDVVVTMPDGKFCRHMSFDNTTASMVEGTIVPCTVDIARDKRPAVTQERGFAWSMR
jgi:hypothetical protein